MLLEKGVMKMRMKTKKLKILKIKKFHWEIPRIGKINSKTANSSTAILKKVVKNV